MKRCKIKLKFGPEKPFQLEMLFVEIYVHLKGQVIFIYQKLGLHCLLIGKHFEWQFIKGHFSNNLSTVTTITTNTNNKKKKKKNKKKEKEEEKERNKK